MLADRFIDVRLKDTLTDPIAQAKRIYEFVGMQFTAEASSYMADWKAENRRINAWRTTTRDNYLA